MAIKQTTKIKVWEVLSSTELETEINNWLELVQANGATITIVTIFVQQTDSKNYLVVVTYLN